MEPNKILEIKNVTKTFPGVIALDNINLNIYKAKVMGLVGENGAGKSTIINVIGGILERDNGSIKFENNEVNFKKINDSKKVGISIVHQELQLAENLSITENIFLGNEIRNKFGFYDWKQMKIKSKEILKELEIDLSPSTIVGTLSIGIKQMVEIGKSIVLNSKLILFDEPTSSISNKESNKLFKIINKLKDQGVSSLYISHRLDELKEICDDITIFRDGKSILESKFKDISQEQIVQKMIGRKIEDQYIRIKQNKGKEILKAENITNEFVNNVSFSLYEGEVLGFFGLIGAGRTELFKSLIGLDDYSGQLYYVGQKQKFKNPRAAIKKGIYYLTEDRKDEGLILDFSILKNISISSLSIFYINKWLPLISHKNEKLKSETMAKRLKTKMTSINQTVKTLSGGNQQKIAISKVLMTMPKIIIFDEPTRGIDVGAKKEIYQLISELKKQGVGIILISSDLPEAIGISDRIILIAEGNYIAEHNAWKTNSSRIMEDLVMKTTQPVAKGRRN